MPAVTVCDPGEADTLKSGAGCGLMVKLTEAECMMVPLVPEMVSPKVPVVLPVTIVRVALPDPLIDNYLLYTLLGTCMNLMVVFPLLELARWRLSPRDS